MTATGVAILLICLELNFIRGQTFIGEGVFPLNIKRQGWFNWFVMPFTVHYGLFALTRSWFLARLAGMPLGRLLELGAAAFAGVVTERSLSIRTPR